MKQHITHEQLSELSDNAKAVLLDWWLNGGMSTPYVMLEEEIRTKNAVSVCALPLLTIGQMIEFLCANDKHGYYYIHSDKATGTSGETLCDALWGAVKQVLEKENK